MSLTIYGIAASRAFRVLWAARELGLAYEHVKHHYKGPEIKGPDYLAVHPLGVVPAIVDDGFALFESLAINLYLARKAGKLWPATLQGEGLVYQWTLFASSEVETPMGQWFYHTTFLPEAERMVQHELNPPKKKAAAKTEDRDVARLEEELADILGAQVKIKVGAKGAGQVAIGFASLDQLDGILEKLR